MTIKSLLINFFLLTLSHGLGANIDDYFKYNVVSSASNYGDTGIFEIPSANFMGEGNMRFSFSSSFPNEYTTITATPFAWMEASYRYTEIKNKPYGPSYYSGNQSLKDKGFDIKLRLKKEGHYMPSMALGLRDIGGTGLTASEYLTTSKTLGPINITAGLGWGFLGSEGGYSNPFTSISESFKQRGSNEDQGGDFNYNTWFSGNAALFAGIEYSLRKYGLKFAIEYDTSEPDSYSFNPIDVKSRFNIGLNYFFSDAVNLGLSFERGNQFRISFTLKGDFSKDTIPKPKPRNVISLSSDQKKKAKLDKKIFYRSLNKSLRDELIFIQAADYDEESIGLSIATNRFSSMPRAVGRSARVVSALADDTINKINIHYMNGDLEVASFSLNRKEFDEANISRGSATEIISKSKIYSNSGLSNYLISDFKPTVNFPEFNWSMSPALKHQIGGPEGFYLGALTWKTDTSLKLKRNLTLYTSIGFNIYDTFNGFKNSSLSTIPHVRSDIQDYLSEGKNNIQRMQLEYLFSPYKDFFIRADIGYLEEMFGGLGGEILYRPFKKNISFSLSAHKVKQRGYKQRFSFRDYKTTTGHFGVYYDFPNNISSSLLIGKYLAGDKGATIDFSRRFHSGFTLGIFATKTDLSVEEFGEGSFDKGFYFSIPVSLFYADFKTGSISFGLHPLTKDGGAILNHHHGLYGLLGNTNLNSINKHMQDLLK